MGTSQGPSMLEDEDGHINEKRLDGQEALKTQKKTGT